MSDHERDEIEHRFISDDSLFEELRSLEDELYLEYSAGELAENDRAAFEKRFLRTRADRERLAFSDAFVEIADDIVSEKRVPAAENAGERTSFVRSVAALLGFAGSSLQMGMAAAAILMAVGLGVVVFQNLTLRREVAQLDVERERQKETLDIQLAETAKREADLERQLSEEKGKSKIDQGRIADIEAESSRLKSELEDARRRSDHLRPPATRSPAEPGPSRSFVALLLSPAGLVRGENTSEASRIRITPATRQVRLTLNLKNLEARPSYGLVIRSVDAGEIVFTSDDVKARGSRISVSVPAARFEHADYEIALIARGPDGKSEELALYHFTVLNR